MDSDRPLKVYVVEDSPAVRERLVEMLLASGGSEVAGHADSPGTAIAGILAAGPDVVLLDLHLIGGTGLEVLKAVHPLRPCITFIVLTNQTAEQYRAACLARGASYYLDKNQEFDKVPAILAGLRASGPTCQP